MGVRGRWDKGGRGREEGEVLVAFMCCFVAVDWVLQLDKRLVYKLGES